MLSQKNLEQSTDYTVSQSLCLPGCGRVCGAWLVVSCSATFIYTAKNKKQIRPRMAQLNFTSTRCTSPPPSPLPPPFRCAGWWALLRGRNFSLKNNDSICAVWIITFLTVFSNPLRTIGWYQIIITDVQVATTNASPLRFYSLCNRHHMRYC